MNHPDSENAIDTDLLRNSPKELLLKYQGIIRIIVRRYVSTGMFRPNEFEDVVQELNAELLIRLPRIRRRYDGSSFVRTYFSAVVRNLCLKMHKKSRRKIRTEALDEEIAADPDDPMQKYQIEHAVGMFRAIMRQYDHSPAFPKLLVGLKLRYRLPLSSSDILRWLPHCPDAHVNRLISLFGGEYEEMFERDVWKAITSVSNAVDRKVNTPDAFKKWVLLRIQEILALLNGEPRRTHFDQESLKVLVEDYFSPFLMREG